MGHDEVVGSEYSPLLECFVCFGRLFYATIESLALLLVSLLTRELRKSELEEAKIQNERG